MHTVLVVDDDNIIHLTIKRIFGSAYTVRNVFSGEEAMRYLEECLAAGSQLPALVLLDIRMDGMSGLQTHRMMRMTSGLEALPVIYLTAEEDEGLKQLCLSEGAADYLIKPCSPRILQRSISRVLNTGDDGNPEETGTHA